jgi:hypothetical protein
MRRAALSLERVVGLHQSDTSCSACHRVTRIVHHVGMEHTPCAWCGEVLFPALVASEARGEE